MNRADEDAPARCDRAAVLTNEVAFDGGALRFLDVVHQHIAACVVRIALDLPRLGGSRSDDHGFANRRIDGRCQELLLDGDESLRARAADGELAFGTIDSWLFWKLTGGRVHKLTGVQGVVILGIVNDHVS